MQACRYLADLLVEAWEDMERQNPGKVLISPDGELSSAEPDERALPRDPRERLIHAQRLVADRCLYGVDINPMAVEMAKLSLWLITLQKDRPFTFLDHALRNGDALIGVDQEQLRTWSLDRNPLGDAGHQMALVQTFIDKAFEVAIDRRRKIVKTPDFGIHGIEDKERLLREADDAMDLAKLGADLLVATGLASQTDQARLLGPLLYDYERLIMAVDKLRQGHTLAPEESGALDLVKPLRDEVNRILKGRRPFHWPLELPEVFVRGNVWHDPFGFDAIVGNPPFIGGQRITGALGTDYRDYLVAHIANGCRGSADLCAYFFLRADGFLRPGGCLGLLATNTIAQGDTREVGLDQLVAAGSTIIRAVPSRKWPGTASLEVAHMWVRRDGWRGPCVLDDKPVPGITPFLTLPGAVMGVPKRLLANASKSFQGSIVLGMGFVLDPMKDDERAVLESLRQDQRNTDVLFPYLNGEDLNSRPDQSPSRWVINFHDWPLEQAETYSDCMRIVREKVKPERDKNNRKVRRERWWQFAERAPELYATIAEMERVITIAATSRTLAFAFSISNLVFSHATYVFALDSWEDFAILQSALHEAWTRQYASSMKGDLRYTPSDVFETFPFPDSMSSLNTIGKQYYSHRQSIMLSRQEGLTKTYNRFHDPGETASDIACLRESHVEMDCAVAAAYGWDDLNLNHGFHQTKQGLRYTISEEARREVLGRLLTLNHQRYEEEDKLGLHANGIKRKSKGNNKVAFNGQITLESLLIPTDNAEAAL